MASLNWTAASDFSVANYVFNLDQISFIDLHRSLIVAAKHRSAAGASFRAAAYSSESFISWLRHGAFHGVSTELRFLEIFLLPADPRSFNKLPLLPLLSFSRAASCIASWLPMELHLVAPLLVATELRSFESSAAPWSSLYCLLM
jgi:hypothetical protein